MHLRLRGRGQGKGGKTPLGESSVVTWRIAGLLRAEKMAVPRLAGKDGLDAFVKAPFLVLLETQRVRNNFL